jgi:hypothetical protein
MKLIDLKISNESLLREEENIKFFEDFGNINSNNNDNRFS